MGKVDFCSGLRAPPKAFYVFSCACCLAYYFCIRSLLLFKPSCFVTGDEAVVLRRSTCDFPLSDDDNELGLIVVLFKVVITAVLGDDFLVLGVVVTGQYCLHFDGLLITSHREFLKQNKCFQHFNQYSQLS